MRLSTQHRSLLIVAAIGSVVGISAFQAFEIPNAGSAVPVSDFVNFESAHVHPIDMTPDGTRVLAVNTANNTLEIFQVTEHALLNIASIPVGLDPVTVRARTNNEAWVVCQVSDEISIVDLTLRATVRSLLTENEPADVVFAGGKAFVSCAEQEMVQVFNLANLGNAPTNVLLKGEQPRALTVSADGSKVYCAFFESGNQTTVIPGSDFHAAGFCSVQGDACTTIPNDVRKPNGPYGGVVPVPNSGAGFNPPMNPNNPSMPGNHSLVVRKNAAGQWMDDNGGNWTNMVSGGAGVRGAGWDMPDRDIAVIDVANPTTAGVSYKNHLGNILMAMSVHPTTGDLYVVGTDATNEIRFEPNLNGKFLRVNVSRVTAAGNSPVITDLNPHINYSVSSSPPLLRKQSVGDPRGIKWRADGSKAYITGMGSNNVITIASNGTRTAPDPIRVGEGPTGLVIDEARNKAYVLNRFEGTISTLDLGTDAEIARANFFDPTPLVIKAGRRHLYDTHKGSGHGHISCGSCHVDGRWDRLAWDLGNPAGDMVTVNDPAGNKTFHPMKGLKTTQFLLDIIARGNGKLHWRGDKQGFQDFAGAFHDLQGTDQPLSPSEMQEFSDFLAACWHVPNPYRTMRPDTSLIAATVERMANRVRFTGTTFQTIPPAGVRLFVAVNVNCSHCHQHGTGRGHLPGNGSNVTAGQVNMTLNTNMTPDLRTVYRKNGFFYNTTECTSGFGMMADGVMETLFNQPGVNHYLGDYEPELLSWSGGITAANSPQSMNFDLVHAFQDAMPAVGMRMTINGSIGSPGRVNTMKQWRVDKYPMDYAMIVKGIYGGEPRGFYYLGNDNYQSDQAGQTVTHAQLLASAQAGGSPLTWTIVHPNTKIRMGVDQDSDGVFDKDDTEARVNVRSILGGAYVEQQGTMRGDLATQGMLPSTDPYGLGATAGPQVMQLTGLAQPVDWALVELRSNSNPGQVVASRPALVQRSGNLVTPTGEQTITFPGVPGGNYHVVVRHRNHLGVMSFQPQLLGNMATMVDFTKTTTATWGTNAQRNVNGTMVLWQGDVSGNGVIAYAGSGNDRDPILARIGGTIPTATFPGYWPEDVNLDGSVKYAGSNNDRDPILTNVGGTVPTNVRVQQLP